MTRISGNPFADSASAAILCAMNNSAQPVKSPAGGLPPYLWLTLLVAIESGVMALLVTLA